MRLETEAYLSNFGILVRGDVFTFEKYKDEPFMVIMPISTRSDNYMNAVSLRTGNLTYFSSEDLVEYYPNARVAL